MSKKRNLVYVNYFIQNDAWESISHPNLYVLPKEYKNLNDVKAQNVYDSFPLIDKYNYHLRFFLDDKKQGIKGWLDFPPNAVIPIYNENQVYVKVLRLPKDVKIKFNNKEINKQKETETAKVNKENNPNLFFMEDNKTQQQKTPNQNKSDFTQDLFSDLKGLNMEDNKTQQQKPSSQNKSDFTQDLFSDLKGLNMEDNKTQQQKTPSQNKSDFTQDLFSDLKGLNMEDNKTQQQKIQNQNKSDFGKDLFSDLKELNNLGNINPNQNLNPNGAQVFPKQSAKKETIVNYVNDKNDINDKNNENNMNYSSQKNLNSINIGDWGAFSGNNGSAGDLNMDNSNPASSNSLPNLDPNLLNVFSNIPSSSKQPVEEAPQYDFTANLNNNIGKMTDLDFVPDNLPEEDMKDRVNKIINQWSLGGEGKKNLLFLLTTLHEVWKSNSLKIPDMQTLVNNKSKVRTYYKMAMRDLHADKNRDKDPKTKYIASCLYQLLNEANSNY